MTKKSYQNSKAVTAENKIEPLDPVYLKGLNDGKKTAEKEMRNKLYAEISNLMDETMNNLEQIKGIGSQRAEKIRAHMIDTLHNFVNRDRSDEG